MLFLFEAVTIAVLYRFCVFWQMVETVFFVTCLFCKVAHLKGPGVRLLFILAHFTRTPSSIVFYFFMCFPVSLVALLWCHEGFFE